VDDPVPDWHTGIFYDPKNPENLKDFQNRQLFLRIAAQNVPEFAKSFFEATSTLISGWIRDHGSLPAYGSSASKEYSSRYFDITSDWARRFNIEADWVINETRDIALSGILYSRKGIDPVLAFGTWRRSLRPTTAKRSFLLPAWDPNTETQPAFIARANGEWRRLRDEYVSATKAELEKAGLKRVPASRMRNFAKELRYTWAALHQCAGTPIDALADQYRQETEAVRISVTRILRDLGFEPT